MDSHKLKTLMIDLRLHMLQFAVAVKEGLSTVEPPEWLKTDAAFKSHVVEQAKQMRSRTRLAGKGRGRLSAFLIRRDQSPQAVFFVGKFAKKEAPEVMDSEITQNDMIPERLRATEAAELIRWALQNPILPTSVVWAAVKQGSASAITNTDAITGATMVTAPEELPPPDQTEDAPNSIGAIASLSDQTRGTSNSGPSAVAPLRNDAVPRTPTFPSQQIRSQSFLPGPNSFMMRALTPYQVGIAELENNLPDMGPVISEASVLLLKGTQPRTTQMPTITEPDSEATGPPD